MKSLRLPKSKLFNPHSDLFATGASFAAQGFIKLLSSLILTRLLVPSEYGVIGILMSIVFILLLLSDFGYTLCIVRDENGEDRSFLNTAWTMRIARALLHAVIILVAAPFISRLYHAPELTAPLRVLAIWFLIDGLESPAFPVAVRRKQSRIFMYSDLAGTAVAAVVTVVYCYFSRDFWGMVCGTMASRFTSVVISHHVYPDIKPRLEWDRASAKKIFRYSRFVMPSTSLTLLTNQFDRAVFLRLFDLRLMGIYSLAANISAPIESLISRASRMVLYPRCAHNLRTDKSTFSLKYYTENVKLFAAILGIPAVIGGASGFLISTLYDPRYAQAAQVLVAFMIRAALLALSSTSEDMLFATGEIHVMLKGNIFRVIWLLSGSLIGFHFFGFPGFTYGICLSPLPQLIYYLWLQWKNGLLIVRYELYRIGFICAVALIAYAGNRFLLELLPGFRLRLHH